MPSKNVIIHGDSRNYIPKIHTPINCLLTDPPYGIDVSLNTGVLPSAKQLNARIKNDSDVPKAIEVFHSVMAPIVPKLAPEADLYVFTAWSVLEWWIPAVKKISPNIELKMILIWDKGEPGQGDLECNWGCGYEPCLYLKKGRRKNPYRRSAIIHCNKVPSGQHIHSCEKPVPLLRTLLEMSTIPGDLVVDPFSGSGSTSVAAQQLGRNSLAFEIDNEPPRSFVDKSRKRLETQTLF